MKPLEWLALAALGVLGYFFWKNSSQPSTSPACPTQPQLDGWLSDIATGKMTTDDANKLAQSYSLANPPCAAAVSAINAAIAAKSGKATTVVPSGKPFLPGGGLLGPVTKPSIGSGYVKYALTAADAAEDVSLFRGQAGFASDDEFLAANSAIALSVADNYWPPIASFAYRFYPGSVSMRVDTFTPTGRIAPDVGLPTYTSSNPAFPGEFVFTAPFSKYSLTGIAYEGPAPVPALSSGGQRMSLDRGVWAWDAGLVINAKAGSPVTKPATAGVGFASAPLLLASEPWQ